MKRSTYDENNNKELEQKYLELQLKDFKQLNDIFQEFVFEYGNWDEIVPRLEDVLKNCDEIDYEEGETAFAYAVWHFLDRYHRFQIIIGELCKRGYLCHKKDRTIDILEVGSGPAQGLFAFSDHYAALNRREGKTAYTIQSDYVERSNGFRNFLHAFVQQAMGKDKYYMVPFHFGRADNAFDFPFEEYRYNWWGDIYKQKYRNDIVIISNFLTTQKTVEEFKKQLISICKYMRNHGLLIIVGATEHSDKYKNVYTELDGIINHRFFNKKFSGWWDKIFDETFTYNYTDEYGELLREYYCKLKDFLTANGLWDLVPAGAKDNLMEKINQTKEKTIADEWDGIKWKVAVYQKHSFYRGKNKNKVIKSNPKNQDDLGWRHEGEEE